LQFLTKHEYHKTIAQLNGDKFLKRLSSAALESLAIIAYKQPITKGEIEKIRGVNSDYSVQKLLEKELIVIAGRDEKAPGHPLIYTTSKTFMDYFGINTTADLPKIREVLAEQLVEGTLISELDFQTNISSLPKEDEEVEVDIDEVSVEISVLDSADEDEMETEAITEEMLAQLTEEDSVDTSASSDDESKLSEKTDEVKNDE
jgi:segregation and condensation protein B